jgi:hypothetical protein
MAQTASLSTIILRIYRHKRVSLCSQPMRVLHDIRIP